MSLAPYLGHAHSCVDALERVARLLEPYLGRGEEWSYFIREPGASMATFSLLLPWPEDEPAGARGASTPFQRAALERVRRVFEELGVCEHLDVGVDTGWLRMLEDGPQRTLRVCGTMMLRV
ncbi:MAG: hypothetical protein AAGI01_00680 [Myxococcota bacterium]